MKTVDVYQVADFFIRYGHEHDDSMTNLKLQKLLYYAQGWHLALFDAPLFEAELQAWVHGPVQPDIYQKFKRHGWEPIPPGFDDSSSMPSEKKKFLKDVYLSYGPFSAWELERMTHVETPWIKARGGRAIDEPCNEVIQRDHMKRFFRERLRDGKNKKSKKS